MTPPTGLLYVNDVDVATLGVTISRSVRGPWDGVNIRMPSGPVLGSLGRLGLTDAPPADPRPIVAVGRQEAADTATLLSLEDDLKRLVYDGIVRVRVGDRDDREWEALGRVRITPIGSWMIRTVQDVEFVFDCQDPVGEAVAPTIVDFAAGAVECPLGTAVSKPIIRIGDTVTNPVVTVKDHLGQVVQTMGFTVVIGAGEWLEIDCEQQTIVDQDGANQADTFNGATDFIELNPYHGAGLSGPWPTISISGGGLAVAEYRKRWL
ncbi:MAG TPA: hypothetical protein VLH81_09405 [Desulfobacterales bacterium]|nr:hypothetical protein [Desulfobacterales bacterium]